MIIAMPGGMGKRSQEIVNPPFVEERWVDLLIGRGIIMENLCALLDRYYASRNSPSTTSPSSSGPSGPRPLPSPEGLPP
jgi:hypothetical protein